MKICSKCKVNKTLESFSKSARHKDGLNGVCKECRSKGNREHWAKHSSRMTAKQRERHHEDPARNIFYQCKARAKKQGLPFNISKEDIVVPEKCPVLNIPLIVSKGRLSDNSPSIDKKIPSLGYVKGNISIISFKANRIKTNATLADLKEVVKWMEIGG